MQRAGRWRTRWPVARRAARWRVYCTAVRMHEELRYGACACTRHERYGDRSRPNPFAVGTPTSQKTASALQIMPPRDFFSGFRLIAWARPAPESYTNSKNLFGAKVAL